MSTLNSFSIKKKQIIASAVLIVNILVVAGVQHLGTTGIITRLEFITKNDLPAVRYTGLTDMMHDGLRAVAYRAYFVSLNGSAKDKEEIVKEAQDMGQKMLEYSGNVEKLNIPAAAKTLLTANVDLIKDYSANVVKATEAAKLGNTADVITLLGPVEESFEKLEKSLGEVGDLIEKNGETIEKEAEAFAARVELIDFLMLGLGVLLNFALSFWLIKNLMGSLKKVTDELTHTSQDLAGASSSSASTSTELSESSRGQTESLQKTASATQEIAAMVNQTSKSAEIAFQKVQVNEQNNNEALESSVQMRTAMGEINISQEQILEQLTQSNREFGEITKIISGIEDKTKVINDIVFQTRLLSFNAAVEAARAGEHGKGFAVVAEEVGNLAQMSGNAAKEISGLLSKSTQQVSGIVANSKNKAEQLMRTGKEKIERGQQMAEMCEESLKKMSESTAAVSGLISQIAKASQEQSQGIDEINREVRELEQMTQQNSLGAEQASVQAEQLQHEAKKLSKIVEQMTVTVGLPPAANMSAKSEAPVKVAKVISLNQARAQKNDAQNKPVEPPLKKVASDPSPRPTTSSVPSRNSGNFEEF